MIPRFYFPEGRPAAEDSREAAQAKINALFAGSPNGITIPAIKELLKEVLVCRPVAKRHCH